MSGIRKLSDMKPKNFYYLIIFLFLGCALILEIPTLAGPQFSHALHSDLKIECATCHTSVIDSMNAKDNLLPSQVQCAECHEPTDRTKSGKLFDLGPWIKSWLALQDQSRDLIFPHKTHMELGYGGQNSCLPCHRGLEKTTDSEQSQAIPSMAICGTCHDVTEGSDDCSRCHSQHKNLVLKPLDHDTGFLRGHRAKASAGLDSCMRCHSESWCQDCHAVMSVPANLAARPVHHEPGYKILHPLEARLDQKKCSRCHAVHECQGCHDVFRGRLNSRDHRERFRDIHPQAMQDSGYPALSFEEAWGTGCGTCHNAAIPGFEFATNRWHADHASAARKDLGECMACHEEKPDCTNCHGVRQSPFASDQPLGQSPHDPLFLAAVNRSGGPVHRAPANCFSCHSRMDLCSKCHAAK